MRIKKCSVVPNDSVKRSSHDITLCINTQLHILVCLFINKHFWNLVGSLSLSLSFQERHKSYGHPSTNSVIMWSNTNLVFTLCDNKILWFIGWWLGGSDRLQMLLRSKTEVHENDISVFLYLPSFLHSPSSDLDMCRQTERFPFGSPPPSHHELETVRLSSRSIVITLLLSLHVQSVHWQRYLGGEILP